MMLLFVIGMNKFFLENRNFNAEHWFSKSAVFRDFQIDFVQ
jgi:hypothetical protein